MSGQNADDAIAGCNHSLLPKQPCSRDTCGAGGLATEPPCSNLCLGIEDLGVTHLAYHPLAGIEGAQTLREVHGSIDLDSTRQRIGSTIACIHVPVELIN